MHGSDELAAVALGVRRSDPQAPADLLPFVYDELHRLARRALATRADRGTLQTTALLNEAWLRIGQSEAAEYTGREHFLAVAATAMRCVVVDHARRRGAEKRGGRMARLELDDVIDLLETRSQDLVALDQTLDELAKVDARLARIVELRFFGGMRHPEIARVTRSSLRSVERGWSTARAWLYAQLVDEAACE